MPHWEDMDRLFERLWGSNQASAQPTNPLPADIVELDNALQFVFSLPGAKPEDISLTVEDGVLTVTGECTHAWEADENAKVYRREVRSRSSGNRSDRVNFPDLESVDASFNNGLLTVKIPKQEEVKVEPKRIPIKGGHVIEANSN